MVALVFALLGTGTAAASGGWRLPVGDGQPLTLLLLGSDMGPPRDGVVERGNADGFQLLFVSADRQHATIISIPRDAYVPVPGLGRQRINACLQRGPERCVETVEALFGLDVDGYLLTGMRAFSRAVSRFDGIEVEVPRALRVGNTHIAPGRQNLSGPEALVYARDRKSRPDGDVGRSRAQAELLATAHRQVVSDPSPQAVLHALGVLRRHSVTDLSGPELVQLGFEALRLPPANVERATVPGSYGFAGRASVLFLHDSAAALVADAAEDGRIGP
ncbi:MAG: LCP family protein [Nitriliruptor sp.]|uniref:LCP family protein n=1 Tax=Nitriliruptor sp. TaxID=2448056 RepID=UPI0034A0ADF1